MPASVRRKVRRTVRQARPAAEEVGKRLGISNVVEGTAENTQGASIAVILRDDYKPQ